MEKDQLAQLLEEKDLLQKVQIEKIQNLTRMLVTSSSLSSQQELKVKFKRWQLKLGIQRIELDIPIYLLHNYSFIIFHYIIFKKPRTCWSSLKLPIPWCRSTNSRIQAYYLSFLLGVLWFQVLTFQSLISFNWFLYMRKSYIIYM